MQIIRYILLYLFIIKPAISWGQFDTLYYDYNWQAATIENAKYYRVIKPNDFYGYMIVDHFKKNDEIQKIAYSKSKDLTDKTISFEYPDGKGYTMKSGNLKNNKETGKWYFYYENSRMLWYTANYNDGKLDGELNYYNTDGTVLKKEYYKAKDSIIPKKYFDGQKAERANQYSEVMPKPNYDLNQYISDNLKYPKTARENNMTGRVIVKFAVNENGTIADVEVVRHVYPELDEEAIKLISGMPAWLPGKQNGKPVKVYFTQPITFNLSK